MRVPCTCCTGSICRLGREQSLGGQELTDTLLAGETYSVAPNESHKFYYVKDMTPDEAMLIKCFDSGSQGHPNGREGVAQLTPHTAFVDPATPKGAEGRQSIEVRGLVFYK